jgi:hypothetical protein
MELHPEDVASFDRRCERATVLCRRDGGVGDGGGVRVSEIDLRTVAQTGEERRCAADRQAVPADVRHLQANEGGQQRAFAIKQSEARHTRRFGAAFEEELQAEADAEEGASAGGEGEQRLAHSNVERLGGCEVTDTGDDHTGGVREVVWCRRHRRVAA